MSLETAREAVFATAFIYSKLLYIFTSSPASRSGDEQGDLDESLSAYEEALDAFQVAVEAAMPCWNQIRTGGIALDCIDGSSPPWKDWEQPCPSCVAREKIASA